MQRYQANYARLTPVSGGLAFESSFSRALVDAFKMQIPSDARRWDGVGKRWIVASQYAAVCVQLAEIYLGVKIVAPTQAHMPTMTETRLPKLEYLGRCKERAPGESSAFGWVNGGWSIVFPESVLREWFEAIPQAPGEKPTLYAVLAIKRDATAEEIKSAFRRLAKAWHPDTNRGDPDAGEQFKVINHAYEVLSNETKRRKYQAGLALEASLKQNSHIASRDFSHANSSGYRSPLRCGFVLCEGVEVLGRFNVNRILQWEDVVREDGKVLTTSWPMGANNFVENWV